MAYVGEVPESWKKDEPIAKVHVPISLVYGETLNAKPPVKRKRPETSVIAFVLPPPLPKKFHSSVAVGQRFYHTQC